MTERRSGDRAQPSAVARRPQRTLQIATLLLASVVSLAVAEGALRLLGVAKIQPGSSWFAGGNHPRFLFAPDGETGYRLRAGFTGREVALSREFDVAVAVDQRGMRDRPHHPDQPPVVLALGDSLTFGEGVEVDDAFPVLLEQSTGYRVWNGGVPGYSTRQMELHLEQLLASTHPRLVVMSLMPFWDAARLDDPFVYKEGYIVAESWADRLHLHGDNLWSESVKVPVIGPASAWAKAHSTLARVALPALYRLHRAPGSHARAAAAGEARSIEGSAQQLALASQRAAAAGASFVAVLLDSRGPAYRSTREQLETALAAHHVDCIVLDRLLGDVDWTTLRHVKDGHWNRDGHRAVAAALAPLVAARVESATGGAAATAGATPSEAAADAPASSDDAAAVTSATTASGTAPAPQRATSRAAGAGA